MADQILPPLPRSILAFKVEPPEFMDLAANALGDFGDRADGFDKAFHALASDAADLSGDLAANTVSFHSHAEPWSNFLEPWEGPAGEAFATASDAGDQALSGFEDLFIAAPPVPLGGGGGGDGGGGGGGGGGLPFDCPPGWHINDLTGACEPDD